MIKNIVERLKLQCHRSSTQKSYHRTWASFNKFYLQLDVKPSSWESCLILFVGYLVNKNQKPATIKSYISAIKSVLESEGNPISEDRAVLNALVKACKLKNDRIYTNFPIKKGLMTLVVKHMDVLFKDQPYLAHLYKTMYATAYYGLFRVGEITLSEHVVKATDVSVGTNKRKMMFVLRSSKTHNKSSKPQIIKISGEPKGKFSRNLHVCPFKLLERYIKIHRTKKYKDEPFFIFRDRSPVLAYHFRSTLKTAIKQLNMDHKRYNTHGFRSGRSVDLLKMGVSIPNIMKLGRWKSNAVFTYLS